MAWRPNDQFIEGVLDNTVPGKVTGWMRFAGIDEKVIFNLEGNFHRDIRGAKIKLTGDCQCDYDHGQAKQYMQGFAVRQNGATGDMTSGRKPADYVDYPYFEWYSAANGRCVIELDHDQIEILTPAIPACESDPIERKKQAQNMAGFLSDLASASKIPLENAAATGDTKAVERARKVIANNNIRGMKLLPEKIRQQLPPLYSQDGKGGEAVVYVKYFCPDSNWRWYASEGSPVAEDDNRQDFKFFGLVEGMEKELGYFMLSELESANGPMGLPIERDIHWQPKTLSQIAPELFSKEAGHD